MTVMERHSKSAPKGSCRTNLAGEWKVLEDALMNVTDTTERLERLPSRDAYWFGWYAFYPHTDVYTPLN